jgi:sugar (pentulose or hexulose) kinase
MQPDIVRGIAVADVGYTSTKLALYAPDGRLAAERRVPSVHHEGPPYRWIDPEPMASFFRSTLPELDALLPVDVVVPTAHGAAMAMLDADGQLALPIMDYTSEPPRDIVAAYRTRMPSFAESLCRLLPMSNTHALQMYWQSRAHPAAFARATQIFPFIQYVGYRLCGRAVIEVTSMSCQTQLVDMAQGGFSSLIKAEGWDSRFPPMVPAWDAIGTLKPEFCGSGLRGRGVVLAGVHDSSSSYARYLAAGLGDFTLLSTGTWSIAYDTSAGADGLSEARDTAINADIFGRKVAISRFFGGKEYELAARDAAGVPASLEAVAGLVAGGSFALPSFSGSSGPMPGSAGRGRFAGPPPRDAAERASLATLYCALMVSEQLDALGAAHDIVVDGPFARNGVMLELLGQLRPGRAIRASRLLDGTAAGAACLALVRDGELPRIAIDTDDIAPAAIPGLGDYRRRWQAMSAENAGTP